MEPTKRVSIPHLSKMKPLEFIELCYYIRDSLNYVISSKKMWITEKVDGFGLRFGVDANRDFFIESSSSGPQYEEGAFARYNIEKRGESNPIADGYDDIFRKLSRSQILQEYLATFPGGIKIICECLYTKNASWEGDGLRFLNCVYDPKKIGSWATFVCFGAISPKPVDFDELIDKLSALGNSNCMFTSAYVDFVDVNVKPFVDTVLSLEGKRAILSSRKASDRATKEVMLEMITQAQERMADALIAGARGRFGGLEGLVFEIPGGRLFKVVTEDYTERRKGASY